MYTNLPVFRSHNLIYKENAFPHSIIWKTMVLQADCTIVLSYLSNFVFFSSNNTNRTIRTTVPHKEDVTKGEV